MTFTGGRLQERERKESRRQRRGIAVNNTSLGVVEETFA
jgi:hypothetical protein